MENLVYLFDFEFTMFNIDSHLLDYVNRNKIDYINGSLGGVYADIYGISEYYLLKTVAVGNGVFEVYADTSDCIDGKNISRIYPKVKRALNVDYPTRRVALYFPNGFKLDTEINQCSLVAKEILLEKMYKTSSTSIQKAERIEILG